MSYSNHPGVPLTENNTNPQNISIGVCASEHEFSGVTSRIAITPDNNATCYRNFKKCFLDPEPNDADIHAIKKATHGATAVIFDTSDVCACEVCWEIRLSIWTSHENFNNCTVDFIFQRPDDGIPVSFNTIKFQVYTVGDAATDDVTGSTTGDDPSVGSQKQKATVVPVSVVLAAVIIILSIVILVLSVCLVRRNNGGRRKDYKRDITGGCRKDDEGDVH